MRILIVSKTRMGRMACVGGLTLDGSQSLRLLQSNAFNQPQDTPYEVGDVWDLNFRPRSDVIAPHVEDVLVDSARKIGTQANMGAHLLSKIQPWQGGPEELFEGLIRLTANGSGYIGRRGNLPKESVGFWILSNDLCRMDQKGKTRYKCAGRGRDVRITYVGFETPVDVLPQGTLSRVSLARWWWPEDAPDMEERCYLQLSGWFEVTPIA
jgi:hypothetical protein